MHGELFTRLAVQPGYRAANRLVAAEAAGRPFARVVLAARRCECRAMDDEDDSTRTK
jgi:hypothetical protein